MHELIIKSLVKETPHATSIEFEVPDSLQNAYRFVAGQYVFVEKEVRGKIYKRAYSITAPVYSNTLQITVKHTDTGDFSKYLNTEIQVGETMRVSEPKGNFVLPVSSEHKLLYMAFATGSGIAPIFSMLLAVLEGEPESRFALVYGNRSPEDSIFREQLDALHKAFPNRFFLKNVYSRTRVEGAYSGRIDAALVRKVLEEDFRNMHWDKYYICGQEAMKETIASILRQRNVPEEQIYYELFSKPKQSDKVHIKVTLEGDTHDVESAKDTYLLDAFLDAGIDAPYSCQGGFCTSCVATILDGQAEMDENKTLDEEELAAGKILTCVAKATTDTITLTFDL